MDQLWVFDGDDTLWYVEDLYDQARTSASLVVRADGLDPHRWELIERRIDFDNVAIYGLSSTRFPTSCVEAYAVLAREYSREPDPAVSEQVWSAAMSVFRSVAPVHPDARRVVDALRAKGPVVLLTKGDEAVQEKRIADAGLVGVFDEIRIVHEKGESEFQAVLGAYGFDPTSAWSIGNSVRSDINPALQVGMNAVWIDAHVWEFERVEAEPCDARLRVVSNLRDVPLEVIGVPLTVR
jgi:putative hydrolase of the HAD superfamily